MKNFSVLSYFQKQEFTAEFVCNGFIQASYTAKTANIYAFKKQKRYVAILLKMGMLFGSVEVCISTYTEDGRIQVLEKTTHKLSKVESVPIK